MNFSEAVRQMKEGKKVERDGLIYSLNESEVIQYSGESVENLNYINPTDVEATDWQIVEEKKTLSDNYILSFDGPFKVYPEEKIKEAIQDIKADIEKVYQKEVRLGFETIINKRIGKRLL